MKQTALKGDLSAVLADCANITEQIETLKKADAKRIVEVATAEGLVASNVSAARPSPDAASKESAPPEPDSSEVPESTPAEEAPKEPEADGDSLQDIFNKYRK